jgi:hypothetical protein
MHRIPLKERETIEDLKTPEENTNATDPQNFSEGGTESEWD